MAPPPVASSPLASLQGLASLPLASQPETLAREIYHLPDRDLDLALAPIVTHDDPGTKRILLTTFYEETRLRPSLVRLPLLVELARQAEVDPSLRVSIMAELGSTLQAEHGESWSDWTLAIEEHLAEREGLIRVR